MINRVEYMDSYFKDLVILSFDKNMRYLFTKLYSKNIKFYEKRLALNNFYMRLEGFEGEILMYHNRLLIFKFLNYLNDYSKTIKDKKMSNLANDTVKQLLNIINC